MGTHNFIQEHIDVGVNSIKAAKSIASKDQKTLQAVVDILFDGTVDEILSYTDIVIDTELNFVDDCVYKIAEGIYGRADTRYKFTDSDFTDNPLEPFYEYLPN